MRTLAQKIKETLTESAAADLKARVIAATGCSLATYYRYLRGVSHDQRIGVAIAAALGCDVATLIDADATIPAQLQPQHA